MRKSILKLTALMLVSSIALFSCTKNEAVPVSNSSNTPAQGGSKTMSFTEPETPIPGTNENYPDPAYNCNEPSGNCISPIIVTCPAYNSLTTGLMTANLQAFFNGNTYLNYFPRGKITPAMLSYLRSGYAKSIRATVGSREVFFLGGPNVTTSNAFLIVPINSCQ